MNDKMMKMIRTFLGALGFSIFLELPVYLNTRFKTLTAEKRFLIDNLCSSKYFKVPLLEI